MNNTLLQKFIDGKCSPEELKYLKQYFDSESYEELDSLIKSTWTLGPDSNSEGMYKGEIWEGIEKEISKESKTKFIFIKKIFPAPLAMAATILIILGIGLYFNFYQSPETLFISNTSKTPMQLVLTDGSQIWLNHGASISYNEGLGKETREVNLDGEAYFEVAHDSNRPFIVYHDEIQTMVLGTAFNINSSGLGKATISLFQGSVKVRETKEAWMLIPGEELSYSDHGNKVEKRQFELERNNILAWKEQKLLFDNQSVATALQELEKYYKVALVYEEKLLQDKYITCEVGFTETIEEALEIILFPHGMNYTISNENIQIMKNKKPSK